MKKLFLIRHAKSSWIDDTLPDRERPLNSRGRENAPLMAQRASKKWSRPELVLCSPAKRAIQTSEFFKEEWWKEADNKIEKCIVFLTTRRCQISSGASSPSFF